MHKFHYVRWRHVILHVSGCRCFNIAMIQTKSATNCNIRRLNCIFPANRCKAGGAWRKCRAPPARATALRLPVGRLPQGSVGPCVIGAVGLVEVYGAVVAAMLAGRFRLLVWMMFLMSRRPRAVAVHHARLADKRERKGGHGSLKYRQCLHNRIVVKLYIARNNDKRGLLAYVLCI